MAKSSNISVSAASVSDYNQSVFSISIFHVKRKRKLIIVFFCLVQNETCLKNIITNALIELTDFWNKFDFMLIHWLVCQ